VLSLRNLWLRDAFDGLLCLLRKLREVLSSEKCVVSSLTAIRVPAGTKKLVAVLFLSKYVPMVGTIFMCADCFLCVVSDDLVSFS
jgi:hypothetical protein